MKLLRIVLLVFIALGMTDLRDLFSGSDDEVSYVADQMGGALDHVRPLGQTEKPHPQHNQEAGYFGFLSQYCSVARENKVPVIGLSVLRSPVPSRQVVSFFVSDIFHPPMTA